MQLNYIPAPHTIFTHVKKLLPGHFLRVRGGKMITQSYYSIPYEPARISAAPSYEDAQATFISLMKTSVQRRLVSDVPLGAFLSGGIDSSVVTGLASRYKPDLHTFSIGFRDERFFDETPYAELVARHFNTKHTVFSLTNQEMYAHLHNILDATDEPFADSSQIPLYLVAGLARTTVTVALTSRVSTASLISCCPGGMRRLFPA